MAWILRITEDALEAVAEQAFLRGTGSRGLRAILGRGALGGDVRPCRVDPMSDAASSTARVLCWSGSHPRLLPRMSGDKADASRRAAS